MSYQGSTSDNNEITEEGTKEETFFDSLAWKDYDDESDLMSANGGTIGNNNDMKEDMYSDISKGYATVFVAYNGKWESDGKELVFKNSKSSIIVVRKNITLSDITHILYEHLDVDKKLYRLKLEVHYRTESPWFHVTEIQNNQHLSVFISESSKTRLTLCVTRLDAWPEVERTKDDRLEERLMKAIRKDAWVKAREIVNKENVTWTSKLDKFGQTALHFAAGKYKDNEVVRNILMGINHELLVTTVKNDGETPAHTAALFGNTEALTMMLASNTKCLFIPDNTGFLPIHSALGIPAIKTFLYLFKQMKSDEVNFDKFIRGIYGFELLCQLIDKELVDVAYELIDEYPSLATTYMFKKDKFVTEHIRNSLGCIIRKPELFYSGTHYNWCQRFIYRFVPTENNSVGSSHTADAADVENQKTPKKDKSITKRIRRYLYDVISRICVKLWEKTLMQVPSIKQLKDEKVKHNRTIKLLRRICEEIDRTHTSSDIIERLYSSPFCLAVENNTAEAIDVLTTYFARLYASRKDEQNIYQLTVLNRSEKVYSYILHHERYAKSDFSISIDDEGNNILHLAGRLAPLHKLNVASGAALQMQREIQWFEEVKKVVKPAQT